MCASDSTKMLGDGGCHITIIMSNVMNDMNTSHSPDTFLPLCNETSEGVIFQHFWIVNTVSWASYTYLVSFCSSIGMRAKNSSQSHGDAVTAWIFIVQDCEAYHVLHSIHQRYTGHWTMLTLQYRTCTTVRSHSYQLGLPPRATTPRFLSSTTHAHVNSPCLLPVVLLVRRRT